MSHEKIRSLALWALGAALLSVSGVMALPAGEVGITLQTFTLFLLLLTLGGKGGTVACGVYLMLGAAGLPVFSGFRGGISMLLGPSGGYLLGFLVLCLIYWACNPGKSDKNRQRLGMVLGLAGCYICGSLWQCWVYTSVDLATFLVTAARSTLPFIIPDVIKMACADALVRRLEKAIGSLS